jgi:hypothetical protein
MFFSLIVERFFLFPEFQATLRVVYKLEEIYELEAGAGVILCDYLIYSSSEAKPIRLQCGAKAIFVPRKPTQKAF